MQIPTDLRVGVVQYVYLLHQRRKELVLLRQIAATAAAGVAIPTVRRVLSTELGVVGVRGVQQAGIAEAKAAIRERETQLLDWVYILDLRLGHSPSASAAI